MLRFRASGAGGAKWFSLLSLSFLLFLCPGLSVTSFFSGRPGRRPVVVVFSLSPVVCRFVFLAQPGLRWRRRSVLVRHLWGIRHPFAVPLLAIAQPLLFSFLSFFLIHKVVHRVSFLPPFPCLFRFSFWWFACCGCPSLGALIHRLGFSVFFFFRPSRRRFRAALGGAVVPHRCRPARLCRVCPLLRSAFSLSWFVFSSRGGGWVARSLSVSGGCRVALALVAVRGSGVRRRGKKRPPLHPSLAGVPPATPLAPPAHTLPKLRH